MRLLRRVAALSASALIAVAVLGPAAACAPSVHSARFVEAAPVAPDHEIRLFSTRAPTCPYDEIGLVVVRPASGFTSLQSMLDHMKQRAREMGGDAIVALTPQQGADAGGEAGSRTTLSGTVVRLRGRDCGE
jgi:hypothetical protein